MRVRKAVIPAAGLGTRFLPATKAQPKEMLPIIDVPTIQFIIEEAVAAGITDIIVVTGRHKSAIENHFDRVLELEMVLERDGRTELLRRVRDLSYLADIHFIRQKEALGLGHAVLQAWSHVGDEPFAVLLGDEVFTGEQPCIGQLVEQAQQQGGNVLAVRHVPRNLTGRYGIVDGVPTGPRLHRVTDLVEKPKPQDAPSTMAIVGRYVLQPAIFEVLANQPPGFNGEIQLTDAICKLRDQQAVFAYEVEGTRYDVGEPLGYVQATVEMALRRKDIGEALYQYLVDLLQQPRP